MKIECNAFRNICIVQLLSTSRSFSLLGNQLARSHFTFVSKYVMYREEMYQIINKEGIKTGKDGECVYFVQPSKIKVDSSVAGGLKNRLIMSPLFIAHLEMPLNSRGPYTPAREHCTACWTCCWFVIHRATIQISKYCIVVNDSESGEAKTITRLRTNESR